MRNLYAAYRAYAEQHALYRFTRDEIARLSPAEVRDLGISPCDAEQIARKAVWG
jgi:uncharacterized protein YjiS (DUF1127 family)